MTDLMEGASLPRIILIEADSFCGKSSLIHHLKSLINTHNRINLLEIDFNQSPYPTLSQIIEKFHISIPSEQLPESKRARDSKITISATASAANSTLASGASVNAQVSINSEDIMLSANRTALLQDLRNLNKRLVIFIDTLEKSAGTQEYAWIDHLTQVAESNNNLIVIIAGKNIPLSHKINSVHYKRYTLTPITHQQHWESWLLDIGGDRLLNALKSHIDVFCEYGGNPMLFLPTLAQNYMRKNIDSNFSLWN